MDVHGSALSAESENLSRLFGPRMAVSRHGLMESCRCCHYHGGPPDPRHDLITCLLSCDVDGIK